MFFFKIKNNPLGLLLFIFITTSLLNISCGNREENVPLLDPVILSISPQTGKVGDIITITRNYFGTDKSKVQIKFNTTAEANIVSVAETRIEVEVPAGLIEPIVDISVLVGNFVSNKKSFSYIIPSLNNINDGKMFLWFIGIYYRFQFQPESRGEYSN